MRWHLVVGGVLLVALVLWATTQGGSLPVGGGERVKSPAAMRDELLAGEVLVAEFTPAALEEPVFRFTSVEGTGWVWEWLGNYDDGRSVLAATGAGTFLAVDERCYFPVEGIVVPLIPWLTLDFLPMAAPRRNEAGNLEFDIHVPGETPVRVEEDLSQIAGGVLSLRTIGTARGSLRGTYVIREATRGEQETARALLDGAEPSAFGLLSLTARPLGPVNDKKEFYAGLLLIPDGCSEQHLAVGSRAVLGWDPIFLLVEPGERVTRLNLRREGDALIADVIDLGESATLEYADDERLLEMIGGRSAAPVEIERWMTYAAPLEDGSFVIYQVNEWRPEAGYLTGIAVR